MQPVIRIPMIGHLIGLAIVWYVGTLIVTWFFVPLFLTMIVLALGSVIGALHLLDLTKPLRKFKYGVKIMDLLDMYTSKQAVIAGLGGHERVNARDEELPAKKLTMEDVESLRIAIKHVVCGQDDIVDAVTLELRRAFAQVRRMQPVGVYFFGGPPGVGKTLLANEVGKTIGLPFEVCDMTACVNEHGATTIFGSPKGYAGSDKPGTLIAFLRRNPDGIVLLDEIDKACPEVQTRFLTAFNDGYLVDVSTGEKVATNRALFFLTSNAAEQEIMKHEANRAPDGSNDDQIDTAIRQELIDAGIVNSLMSRVSRVFVFKRPNVQDRARIVVTVLRQVCAKYGKALVKNPTAIEPELLVDLTRQVAAWSAVGGIRQVNRAIDRDLAESLIDLDDRVREVRVRRGEGRQILAEAA